MFGHATPECVRMPYETVVKPGVRFVRDTITAIDTEARRVTTEGAVFEADVIVIALGADYDVGATPGLAETGNEFYSVPGAERVRELLPTFTSGRVVVGICGAPYKCPPAPSETVLLLHDYLSTRGVRDNCEITLVTPLGSPVPPSPDTSRALIAAFAERNIAFVPNRRVASLEAARRVRGTIRPTARGEGVVRLEPASPLVRRAGAAAGNSPYQLDGLRGLTA